MKKIGILLFATALVIGLVVSNIFSFGKLSFPSFNFSMGLGGVRGSGNVIKETRDISGFKKIDVSGVFQVEVTTGSEYRVEVEADDNLMPLIETEVNGDTLSIETDKHISGKSSLKVRIVAPNINAIETSGASNVSLSGVKNDELSLNSSGASKITVSGQTGDLTVELSGASRLNAEALSTTNAKIDGSGASNAVVNVTGELNSDLSGASHVTYTVTPSVLNTKASGAGSVSAR